MRSDPPTKPPLGLLPRAVYDTQCHVERAADIEAAIERYSTVGCVVPPVWVDELAERMALIHEREPVRGTVLGIANKRDTPEDGADQGDGGMAQSAPLG